VTDISFVCLAGLESFAQWRSFPEGTLEIAVNNAPIIEDDRALRKALALLFDKQAYVAFCRPSVLDTPLEFHPYSQGEARTMTNRNRNWIFVAAILITLTMLAVSILAAQSKGEKITLEGVIGDTVCGAKHKMKDLSDKECTKRCVELGSQYALIVGDKTYELDRKTGGLDKLAGSKAKVEGIVNGDQIQVASVSAVK